MKNINKDIKEGQFKQIYLLYGPEDYLKRQYKNKLKNALVDEQDSMNYRYFYGTNININEIIDISETLPFFAERRLIILEDTGIFKSPKEQLVNYLGNLPSTTNIIFIEDEIDKRGRLYKKIKEIGYVCELSRQTEDTLITWISGLIKEEKKDISKETIRMFLLKTGFSMDNISTELEKLLSYTMGRNSVTSKDVEVICTTEITGKIFEMIDAMSTKNRKNLFVLYQELIAVKEPPMRILFMLSRQFNIMLQIQDLIQRGYSQNIIQEKLKLHSFIINKTTKQLKNFSQETIGQALHELLNIEEQIKTGMIQDKIGLELFLSKISEK